MKKALLFLFAMAVTSPAFAVIIQPNITVSAVSLGGGLSGYTVSIVDPSAAKGAFFLDHLTFTGPIGQLKAFGAIDVNDDTNANTFNVIAAPAYQKALDSYFFAPFTANTVAPGITQTANTYAITAGSGGGNLISAATIAYIVGPSGGPDVVHYSGTVSRGVGNEGADFQVAGVLAVPEPGTLALLGLGAMIAIPVLRRRKA